MSLQKEQAEFTKDLNALLSVIHFDGYEVSIKEALRTKEQQEIYFKTGKSKTMNSMHLKSLAVDLAIFKNGVLLQKKEDLQKLGDYWESLDDKNRWGGNFKSFYDGMHFERFVK